MIGRRKGRRGRLIRRKLLLDLCCKEGGLGRGRTVRIFGHRFIWNLYPHRRVMGRQSSGAGAGRMVRAGFFWLPIPR